LFYSRAFAVRTLVIVLLTGLFIVGCSGSSQKDAGNPAGANLQVGEPLVKSADSIDAARLLTQASFGVTANSLIDITGQTSLETWIDEQMALPATLQLPRVQAYGNTSLRPPRHYVWWETVVSAEDQLRQRVAFALSEIFVVSDIDYTLGNAQHGIVSYYDMLTTSAFGNFRDLLEDITLHPVMGIYLSMLRNEKADPIRNIRPDENYAREIMQLFTIGLYELNEGGTPIPVGNPKPAYTQSTVEEYARVFTGWNFADSPEWQSNNLTQYDKITPLVPQEQYHDTGSKQLLGGVIAPAGLTAREDMKIALDSLFNHPNVGPFIGKALIQRLVTSNPSEQYVARVAAAFNDNGQRVRGDMGAVVKAILLDNEARQTPGSAGSNTALNFGKMKEPLLRATHILRALNASPGAQADSNIHFFSKTSDVVDDIFGQAVLSSPSVFNFFSPDFVSSFDLAGGNQTPLYAPELQILTESLLSAANNDLHSLLYNSNNRSEKNGRAAIVNIDAPIAMLRKGRNLYLEHMNMLLMSGSMSEAMQDLLAEYIDETVELALPDADDVTEGESDADVQNLSVSQVDITNEKLKKLSEEQMETIVKTLPRCSDGLYRKPGWWCVHDHHGARWSVEWCGTRCRMWRRKVFGLLVFSWRC